MDDCTKRVSALLDHERTQQILRAFAKVTYSERAYATLGAEDGCDPSIMLCAPCKSLVLDPPPSYWNATDWSFKEPLAIPERFWKWHHGTLFQLIDCCLGDSPVRCNLCTLFWHALRCRLREQRLNGQTVGTTSVSSVVAAQHNCHSQLKVSRAIYGNNGSTGVLNLNMSLRKAPRERDHWLSMHFVSGQNCENQNHQPLSDSTASDATITQIKDWFALCQSEHHTHCKWTFGSNSAKEKPTRLIYCDPVSNTVRVVDSEPESTEATRYLALSYRWGLSTNRSYRLDETTLMLTSDTDKALRSGISVSSLPQTIQDAINITIRLGYQHLWVDRFCIYQDSASDWNHEAGRMGHVYKHAELTIAASCANYEDDGFLRNRGPNGGGLRPLCLKSVNRKLWSEDPAEPTHLQASDEAVSRNHDPSYHFDIDWETRGYPRLPAERWGNLARRGWVFQERMLAPRTIHFADQQVFWDCQEMEANETDPTPQHSYYPRPTLRKTKITEAVSRRRNWHQLVEEYSHTQLTFSADRLPALSGLAREFQNLAALHRNGEDIAIGNESTLEVEEHYYAGLWATTFLIDLTWSNVDSDVADINHDLTDMHALDDGYDYIAPSWSWASAPFAVKWRSAGYPGDIEHRYLALLKDMHLQYASDDKFGALKRGSWLHLSGKLHPVFVGITHDQLSNGKPYLLDEHGERTSSYMQVSIFQLDDPDLRQRARRRPVQLDLMMLLMAEVQSNNPDSERVELWCLLLLPSEPNLAEQTHRHEAQTTWDVHCYRRAGLICLDIKPGVCEEWMVSGMERSIALY